MIKKSKTFRLLLIFIIYIYLFLPSLYILTQIGIPKVKIKDIVEVKLLPIAQKFAKETDVVILVEFTIQDKYHIYHPTETKGIPTEIKVDTPAEFNLYNIIYPPPVEKNYPKIGGVLKLYEKKVFVAVVLKAHKIGNYTLNFTIKYGACSDIECLAPETKQLSTTIDISEQSMGVNDELLKQYTRIKNIYVSQNPTTSVDNFISKINFLLHNKILKFLGYLILGIISAFTPCILPVLPLTIGWLQILSRNNTIKYIGLILLYILSGAIIFGILGIIANLTGGFLGFQLGNIYLVTIVSAFFIILTYLVLGDIEIPTFNLPAKFSNSLLSSAIFGGLTGIFLSPCVGPILLWLLTKVAQNKSSFDSFLSLFIYAVGLNIPLILGAFSISLIKNLSRAQYFSIATKIIFGILILGSIIFFAWGFLLKIYGILAIITIILGILIKQYIKYYFKNIPEIINQIYPKVNRATFIIFLVLTIGFFSKIIYTYNRDDKLFNKGTIEEAIANAKEHNKILLVKFFAKWCIKCWEQKYTLFSDPEIIKMLESFYLNEVDCTEDVDNYCKKKFQELGVSGLPVIVFYDKNGQLYKDYIISGDIGKDKFLTILNTLKTTD